MSDLITARGPRTHLAAPIATFIAVLLLLSGCTSSTEQSPELRAPAPPLAAVSPDALANAVTLGALMRHLRALETIAEDHGGNRAAGTPGYDASLDYVAGQLRQAGFAVSTPTFDYTRFSVGPVSLRSDASVIDAAAVLEYSPGTAGTTITAPPATIDGLGCTVADYPARTRGAIAVVTRGTCTFVAKARAAQQAGARALIVVNDTGDRLFGGTLGVDNGLSIPVVGVTRPAGDQLRTATSVELRVVAESTRITSRNLIAETTTGSPDNVVMAGAHLDSVPAGPGINDNGTGTAAVLETALRLGPAPKVGQRVRFAFWGAEEDGLIGSTRYVASLDAAALRQIALYLNFDMLGSPNAGYLTYDGDNSTRGAPSPGPPGSGGIERVFLRFFTTFGPTPIPVQPTAFDGRSDYGPFIDAGIPAGGIAAGAEERKTPEQARFWGGEAGKPFDPNYHSAADTVANVNTAAFAVNAAAVAYAVGTYAISIGGPDGVPGPDGRDHHVPVS
ncbi:M28 family peptidase [Gordonia sp. ABSL1-1]|uniref:M28 family peptidase n=1 Tax=Gordonia sp. ABSL1-1 TaxID=3053923 RepID=UPI002573778A|nr:M28 family peptidase [Gordonia sp. ABSL1-1]MDL9935497.1 M28 family peptidase [Gordonia sp. ABSL1-1]